MVIMGVRLIYYIFILHSLSYIPFVQLAWMSLYYICEQSRASCHPTPRNIVYSLNYPIDMYPEFSFWSPVYKSTESGFYHRSYEDKRSYLLLLYFTHLA